MRIWPFIFFLFISKSFSNDFQNSFSPPPSTYNIHLKDQKISCTPTFEKSLCKISDKDFLFFHLGLGDQRYIHLSTDEKNKMNLHVFKGETELKEYKIKPEDSNLIQYDFLNQLSKLSIQNLEYTDKANELNKSIQTITNSIKEKINNVNISINVNNEQIKCTQAQNISITDCQTMTCSSKNGDMYFMNVALRGEGESKLSDYYKPHKSNIYKNLEKNKKITISQNNHLSEYNMTFSESFPKREYHNPELNENNNLVQFLNTGFFNIHKNNIRSCSTNLQKEFEETKNYYDIKLAEEDVILLIGYLQNPSFISPTTDPSLYCDHDGTKIEIQYKDENLNYINTFKSTFSEDKAITKEKLNEIFNQAKDRKDLYWSYKMDGCFARAEILAQDLSKEGIYADKIWTSGNVNNGSIKDKIEWGYHVAPLVYVKEDSGLITPYVIDLATFDKPATMNEWLEKTNTNTNRKMLYSSVPTRAQGNSVGRNIYSISNRFLSNLGDKNSNENNQAQSYQNSTYFLKSLQN